MSTISLPECSPETTAARRRLKGPILLATDGTAQSTGAFAAAVCVAAGGTRRADRVSKLTVRVVAVCDALPIVSPGMPHDDVEGLRAEMLASALAQVRYNVSDTSNWRVDVLTGLPAPTIAVAAAEAKASLVVMGVGRHLILDRVFGSETALRVMRVSSVPVLAVPQNWIGVPRHVLVAVDFGPASLRAARTAMRIIPSGGVVCFAHVASNNGLPDCDERLAELYRNNLNEEFDRFVEAVGVPDDVTVARTRLYGETAPALLKWASMNCVDMIVTGTHGANAFARLIVGSVASQLVRGAHCAILVASAPRRDKVEADLEELRSRPSWHQEEKPIRRF